MIAIYFYIIEAKFLIRNSQYFQFKNTLFYKFYLYYMDFNYIIVILSLIFDN